MADSRICTTSPLPAAADDSISVANYTEILDDGTVRVCLGQLCGTVSSWHLVEPKLNQLRRLHEARTTAPEPAPVHRDRS